MSVTSNTLAHLLARLDSGQWAPGTRLPPERQLAKSLGVGRSSLRVALAELERLGRIRRHVGQGTFVLGSGSEEVVTTLRIDPPPSPADVFELRMMIEPAIAAAAAMRASAPAVRNLRTLIGEGRGATDWADWERADKAFHTALGRASRNPLLVGVLETVNVIRSQREWGEMRSATLNPERQRRYTEQHTIIVDAISANDPAGAAAAMRDHLTAVNRTMLGDVSDPALAALAT